MKPLKALIVLLYLTILDANLVNGVLYDEFYGIHQTTVEPEIATTEKSGSGSGLPDYYYNYDYETIKNAVNDESRLVNMLFPLDRNYAVLGRPVYNSSKPIDVDLTFILMFFFALDERQQTLTTFGWIQMVWIDELHRWNPKKHASMQTITMPTEYLWVPDVGIANSAGALYGEILDPTKLKAIIYSNGKVVYTTSGNIITTCLLDVTYFPFDAQACYIILESWSLGVDQLRLHSAQDIDTRFFQPNSQWELTDYNITEETERDHDRIRMIFHLKRKPVYYMLTIVMPCVVVTVLSVFVFIVPQASMEKISLQVTIIFSFSLFQFSLNANLPKTSDHTPLVSDYLLGGMALAAFGLIVSVIIQFIYYFPQPRATRWLRYFTFDILDQAFQLRRLFDKETNTTIPVVKAKARFRKAKKEAESKVLSSNVGNGGKISFGGFQVEKPDDLDEECLVEEFPAIAEICDRLFFIISVMIVVGMTGGMIISFLANVQSSVDPLEA